MGLSRTALVAVLVACGAPEPPAAPAPPAQHQQLRGEAFGTTWTVRWGPDEVPASAVEPAVVAVLQEVDAAMSTWRDDSDLSRVRSGDGPVPVRAETADVVEAALSLAQTTGGAFDPTVQPLMELWGLLGKPRTTWPTEAERDTARGQVGWDRVTVRRTPEVTVDAGGTALDLSAIAKGHAVDRVLHAVVSLGATDAFVDIGGEVRVAGRGPRGGWRIGVERPVVGSSPAEGLAGVLEVSNLAVATSGNYRTRYTVDGRVVHHTLDPRTGGPADSDVLSATVVAPDCRTADGWATALMVLGSEAGLALVRDQPMVDAWLLVADGEAWRAVGTEGAFRHVVSADLGEPVEGE